LTLALDTQGKICYTVCDEQFRPIGRCTLWGDSLDKYVKCIRLYIPDYQDDDVIYLLNEETGLFSEVSRKLFYNVAMGEDIKYTLNIVCVRNLDGLYHFSVSFVNVLPCVISALIKLSSKYGVSV